MAPQRRAKRDFLSLVAAAGALVLAGCNWNPHLPPDRSEDTPPRPRIRVPDPVEAAAPGQSANLLQHYIVRDTNDDPRSQIPAGRELEAEARGWTLPFKSKRMVAALITTAARDRLGDLDTIVHPDAQWGLPDPRMLESRPVFAGDEGERFLQALRRAAARFPETAKYVNATEFHLGVQERLRAGAEPMWAYYENDLDRILFRMRVIAGRPFIDYIGMFPAAPTGPIQLRDKGTPPPMTPPVIRPDGQIQPTLRTGQAQPIKRQPAG